MANPPIAVVKETCHGFNDGKLSIITVNVHPCNATKLPTPNTNNITKNNIAKS